MKASVLAAVLALAAGSAAAQTSPQQPADRSATPQSTRLPEGGLVLDFKQIDRNNDRVISVEEWNDFIASLRTRSAERGSNTERAASGATGTTREPKR